MLLVAAQPRAEYHAPGEHNARGDRPPIAVVGSTTREVFEAYVERILLPTLRPGQIVVMDNLAAQTEGVAEAAVIGRSHETKGEEPVGFVILEKGYEWSEDMEQDLIDHVAEEAGSISKPARVFAVDDLPKTNSGKIMRRILENISEGEELGDTSTLSDPSIAETIQEQTQQQMQ